MIYYLYSAALVFGILAIFFAVLAYVLTPRCEVTGKQCKLAPLSHMWCLDCKHYDNRIALKRQVQCIADQLNRAGVLRTTGIVPGDEIKLTASTTLDYWGQYTDVRYTYKPYYMYCDDIPQFAQTAFWIIEAHSRCREAKYVLDSEAH